MLRPVRTSAPAQKILTTVEVKAQLRIDHADEDELIDALIDAATDRLDGYSGVLGRCLITQTWVQKLEEWEDDELCLPFPDVQSITNIKYYDAGNAQQLLASSKYRLHQGVRGSFIKFDQSFDFPTLYDREDAIEVTFVAGYGDAPANVPAILRVAAKMLIAHLYETREAVGDKAFETPLGFHELIAPYRRIGL